MSLQCRKKKNNHLLYIPNMTSQREEWAITKAWKANPSSPSDTQVFLFCPEIERYESLIYYRKHNLTLSKNLRQRLYVLKSREGLAKCSLWSVNLRVTDSRGCQRDRYCSQEIEKREMVPASEQTYSTLKTAAMSPQFLRPVAKTQGSRRLKWAERTVLYCY